MEHPPQNSTRRTRTSGRDGRARAGRSDRLRAADWGFEGAVTYLSGFQIVHRYAYVVVPVDGDPFVVFPSRPASWRARDLAGRTGLPRTARRAIAAHGRDAGWRRAGSTASTTSWACATSARSRGSSSCRSSRVRPGARSEERGRAGVRARLASDNQRGFELWARRLPPGRPAAEVMAVAEEYFVARGVRPADDEHGAHGAGPSGACPSSDRAEGGGRSATSSSRHSRSPARGCTGSRSPAPSRPRDPLSDETKAMAEAYVEYYEAARSVIRAGATCHDVHTAVSKGFLDRATTSATSPGHSIGMTMIEFPKIGEGVDDRAAREHGASRCTRTRSPRTARTASTCRTHGSSRATAGCRSPTCPWRSSCDEPGRRSRPDEDGLVRCWWGGAATLPTARTTTRSGARRSPTTCGCSRSSASRDSSGALLAHDPSQARGVPARLRRLRLRRVARFGARDVERLLGDAGSSPPREDRVDGQQRAARGRARRGADPGGVRLAVRAG